MTGENVNNLLLADGSNLLLADGSVLLLDAEGAPSSVEAPTPAPPILSGGGAAYVRARLGLDTSEALLKRIRKSLGLDRDVTKPRTSETITEVIDFSAPIMAAVEDARAAVAAAEQDDEEVILLLAAA